MKRALFALCSILVVLLIGLMCLFPVVANAGPVVGDDPTPAQIQAITNALTALTIDTSADQTLLAAVTTDSAALTLAQTNLTNDQAAEAPSAAKVATDVTALQQAVAALTPAQQAKLKLRLTKSQVATLESKIALVDSSKGVVVTSTATTACEACGTAEVGRRRVFPLMPGRRHLLPLLPDRRHLIPRRH